jgi:alcohol dehydrogenase class IV
MIPFAGEFALSRLERVVSGPGALAAIAGEFERLGCTRVLVVTGKTLSNSPLIAQVTSTLAGRCAGVFARTAQHVPASTVDALVRMACDVAADGLVSFGGGSPIDAAKAAVHVMLTSHEAATGPLPHIAVPTTLSAGEFTGIAGVTDDRSLVKRPLSDPRLAPVVVITDPVLTLETPDWLWTSTGIRALDHAVESIYSVRHHPFSDALASAAIALLMRHLPDSRRCDAPDALADRGQCQLAAWQSVFGISNTGFGLSHAFGHQIGPRWNVPHGFTSCVMLPHAMRFMAAVAPGRFGPIAGGLGVPFDVEQPHAAALACAEKVADFIVELGLPTRLAAVGVPRDDVAEIVGVVHDAMERAQVVGHPLRRDDVAAMLMAAY